MSGRRFSLAEWGMRFDPAAPSRRIRVAIEHNA